MSFQVHGRPRSADQILMAIRAILLEYETRINNLHPLSNDAQVLIGELKKTWGASTDSVARIWQEKVNEIDEELHRRKVDDRKRTERSIGDV